MSKIDLKKSKIAKVFISTSHREPDIGLARKFKQKLENLGHNIFLAKESIEIGEEWQSRLYEELNSCDYLLLLLSENSVKSEMVEKEVECVKNRQKGSNTTPTILPIRVNLPYNVNYDLSKQLEEIHQLDWESEADTLMIVEKISIAITQNSPFEVSKERIFLVPSKLPMPNAPLILEQPSGTVALDSRYYIERESDDRCYQQLNSKYTLVRIKAPRQYGKTSLLARFILRAREQNYRVSSFNFQELDISILNNLDKLLNFICKMTAYILKVEVHLDEMLLQMLTPKVMATVYMEQIIESIDRPFVFAIDEADRLFKYEDVSNEFFGLIRAWHERSRTDPLWEKLKIVLSHSTEPLLGINDLNQSPFHNVGFGVELQPFQRAEIIDLAFRHGIEIEDNLDSFIELIGGHPYLSRLVLYTMVEEKQSFEHILKNAYSQNSIFYDHIKRYVWIINGNKRLKNTIRELLNGNICRDNYSCYTLEATGLIRNRLGRAEFYCKLYHRFFSKLII